MEIAKLFNALPSAGSQGVIWGIMAIGVYITYRILDVADLTVDGSIATGGAVAAVLIIGEVVFSKIFHNFALKLLAVVIGAILYYIVIQVVLWLGLNTNDLKMLQALVVAMFLAVPYWKHRYVKKKGDANHG